MKNRILIVDDEPNIVFALQRTLLDEPYEIHFAFNGEGALKILNRTHFKVVISDQCLPRMEGAELLSIIKAKYPDTVRIMLTGKASPEVAMKAVNSGEVYRFFTKPWNDAEIVTALRSAVRKYNAEAENRRLLEAEKKKSARLKGMEKLHAGITRLEKDKQGNLIIPEISEEEMARIFAQCDIDLS